MSDLDNKSVLELFAELNRLEHELDYQVRHKRIEALQERIDAIEKELDERRYRNDKKKQNGFSENNTSSR